MTGVWLTGLHSSQRSNRSEPISFGVHSRFERQSESGFKERSAAMIEAACMLHCAIASRTTVLTQEHGSTIEFIRVGTIDDD
jgi:hypothetical protein